MFPHKLQETILSLRAIWAAKVSIPDETVRDYTQRLLTEMDSLPGLGCETAIIMGATNATCFVVDRAVKAGHKKFILLGGKRICDEHPAFTAYVHKRADPVDIVSGHDQLQPETHYARKLLTFKYSVPEENITIFDDDDTSNTGASLSLLRQHLPYPKALEFYTLAGYARRTLMTARKEFGSALPVAVHNSYPQGVDKNNWFEEPVARAHMEAEAGKCLGTNPFYVQLGYISPINIEQERLSSQKFLDKPPTPSSPV